MKLSLLIIGGGYFSGRVLVEEMHRSGDYELFVLFISTVSVYRDNLSLPLTETDLLLTGSRPEPGKNTGYGFDKCRAGEAVEDRKRTDSHDFQELLLQRGAFRAPLRAKAAVLHFPVHQDFAPLIHADDVRAGRVGIMHDLDL